MKLSKLFLLLLLLLLASCKEQVKQEKPLLLASIHPYELILTQLVGTEYEVKCIIPEAASPHTWSPGPADLKALNTAAFILSNGMGLETNLEKNLSSHKEAHVEASKLLYDVLALATPENDSIPEETHADEAEHQHQGQDPHLWTSPRLMIRLVGALEKELSRRFPNSSLLFSRNAGIMRKELEDAIEKIGSERSAYANPGLITYHKSFQYFTDEFGIASLGWVQASPGKEPSPKDLSNLGKTIEEHQVKAIYLEPQMDKKAGEVLAKEFGLKVLTLDPLGTAADAKTITELILYNWNIMKEAF
jgi:zinc transport system substrate-binding protein